MAESSRPLMRSDDANALVDTEWHHPRYRGPWKLARVGKKYVYLASPNPALHEIRVDLVMWPGRWEPKNEEQNNG